MVSRGITEPFRRETGLRRRSVQSYANCLAYSTIPSHSAVNHTFLISVRVINNARNEVRNEESCGAINPGRSGTACWCGHSRGAAGGRKSSRIGYVSEPACFSIRALCRGAAARRSATSATPKEKTSLSNIEALRDKLDRFPAPG